MSETTPKTKFMAEWDRIVTGQTGPEYGRQIRPIFFHEPTRIMAVLDPFAKFAGQIVVAPADGTPGREAHWADLSFGRAQELNIVVHAMRQLLKRRLLPSSRDSGLVVVQQNDAYTPGRVVEHTEGNQIPDHPHTVLFVAEPGEGELLYRRGGDSPFAQPEALDAMAHTLEMDESHTTRVSSLLLVQRSLTRVLDNR